MREILFRGKIKYGDDKGKWVYGYLYVYNEPKIYSILNENNAIELNQYGSNVPAFINVDQETVGQYTGRKDKNGIKIFDGDILEYEFEDIGKQKAYAYWNDKYSSFTLEVISENFGYAPIESGVVIGNIYDNPELLNGRSKDVC